jgi:hypothetical protein
MADTTTTNLLLTKPEVGASTDTWGSKINTDLDSVDAVFAGAGTGTSVGLNIGSGKTLKVAGSTDFSANLTFTGTGNRITGDFSNATVANRVMFQNSVTNAASLISVLPNGTGNTSYFITFGNSDPTNAAFGQFGTSGVSTSVRSEITGTGTYLPMTFHTGGAEAMRITNAGATALFGLGTSSPLSKLQVVADQASYTNDVAQLIVSGTNTNKRLYLGFNTTDDKAFIQATNVGVAYKDLVINPGGGNLLVGRTTQTSSEKVCFEYSSSVGPGLTINNSVSGNGTAIQFSTAGSGVGNITTGTTNTAYNTSSDYRLKNTIAPMTGALAKVALLKPVTYKWKLDNSDGEGFIAHELQEVVPYAVSGEKDGEQMQGVDYSKLTPILTAALQEAIAKIKTLEARVAVLEAK